MNLIRGDHCQPDHRSNHPGKGHRAVASDLTGREDAVLVIWLLYSMMLMVPC